jgi:glyoxylase-like metal-dependent hydrolase (beta-lactamase superfamily II)
MEIKKIAVGVLQANCYLLIDGGELAVIDPGDEAKKIIEEIKNTGARVKYIINTHNHFDHVGANAELEKKFGVKAIKGLKDGEIIKVGGEELKVVRTPGHTPESVCLFGNDFVISGDTLFEDGFGRVDLEGGSGKEMAASLEKLDKLILPGASVYPGHGNSFVYKKGMALEYLN